MGWLERGVEWRGGVEGGRERDVGAVASCS